MSFNLALVLTVLTVFSGVVVLINRLTWRSGLDESVDPSGPRDTLVEYSRSFFPVLLFVLVVRSFVFEPFRIPSGSMMPTLLQGDFIFVTKYSYGLRLPVTESKFVETGEPERGDVIVFRLPQDPSINYIKRVIGLPGDVVIYRDHLLTVNGNKVDQRRDPVAGKEPRFIENNGDREYSILINDPLARIQEGTYVVPEGQFFVMGDNRDNSKDSRYIGFIPESHLVGEAVRIWMHMDGLSWPRWERIGTKIE